MAAGRWPQRHHRACLFAANCLAQCACMLGHLAYIMLAISSNSIKPLNPTPPAGAAGQQPFLHAPGGAAGCSARPGPVRHAHPGSPGRPGLRISHPAAGRRWANSQRHGRGSGQGCFCAVGAAGWPAVLARHAAGCGQRFPPGGAPWQQQQRGAWCRPPQQWHVGSGGEMRRPCTEQCVADIGLSQWPSVQLLLWTRNVRRATMCCAV